MYKILRKNFVFNFITRLVPYTSNLNLKPINLDKGYVKLKSVVNDDLSNHVGSLHAGAGFSLLETVAGGVLVSSFPNISELSVLLKESHIEFIYPGLGEIFIEAELSKEELESINSKLNKKLSCSVEIESKMMNLEKKIVAKGIFTYSLKIMEFKSIES